MVEYYSPGGNSQDKEDVQEVATIESTRRSCYLKKAKRDAKRTVAVKRASAAQELYDKLDTREGEKAIYRLAKSRDQATKDNYQGYFVKAEDGTLLLNTEEHISR